MLLKKLICFVFFIEFLLCCYIVVEDLKMTGGTSFKRTMHMIVYFLLFLIVMNIPAEKYWTAQDEQEPDKQAEVEVFSIQPKIENGDTTYIIKYRTK